MNISEVERFVKVIDQLVDIQNKGRVANSYDIESIVNKLARQVAAATITTEEEVLSF